MTRLRLRPRYKVINWFKQLTVIDGLLLIAAGLLLLLLMHDLLRERGRAGSISPESIFETAAVAILFLLAAFSIRAIAVLVRKFFARP